jgi:hypothetical protein
MTSPAPDAAPRTSVTDSPWFWAAIFGLFALAGLAAISPKFLVRQSRLDVKHAGREEAWRSRTAGEPAALAAEGIPADAEHLTGAVPLSRVRWIVGGLALLLAAIVYVAAVRLRAERRAAAATPAASSGPSADQAREAI